MPKPLHALAILACILPSLLSCQNQSDGIQNAGSGRSHERPSTDTADGRGGTIVTKQVSGEVIGLIKNPSVTVLRVNEGTFLYAVTVDNDTGQRLDQASAHLYLLASDRSTHEIRVQPLGAIAPGGKIEAIWRFDTSSQIHKQLAKVSGPENAHQLITLVPDLEVYIKSRRGVYEIDSTNVTIGIPIPGDGEPMVRQMVRKRWPAGRQEFAKYFTDAGIERPSTPNASREIR